MRLFPLLLPLLLTPISTIADTLSGRVVGITDGDTVTVLAASNEQHKVRLMGIDAPEKKQPYGQKSKQLLSDLIYDKHVNVEYSKTDRYRRKIGKVLINGVDANLELVKAGMAWHYKKYQNEQSPDDRVVYAQAEELAKKEGRGLWQDSNPIPPWDWRHSK